MSKFKFSETENNLVYDELDAVRYGGEEQIDIAISRIEQIVSERDGWIDVDDTPPPSYQRVLFWDSRDCNVCVGYFVWDQTPVNYVTHWQPLPSPPKQPKK